MCATATSPPRTPKRAASIGCPLHHCRPEILGNLDLPEKSAIKVPANRHGISPRYVNMLFEAGGLSVSEFVLAQRLMQAHRMLLDPRLVKRAISAIAYDVGFSDLSYFNRTFRRRYGVTPTDVRDGSVVD